MPTVLVGYKADCFGRISIVIAIGLFAQAGAGSGLIPELNGKPQQLNGLRSGVWPMPKTRSFAYHRPVCGPGVWIPQQFIDRKLRSLIRIL